MKISCKFGEPSCCCFPLRALTPTLNQSIHRMLKVDTMTDLYIGPTFCLSVGLSFSLCGVPKKVSISLLDFGPQGNTQIS